MLSVTLAISQTKLVGGGVSPSNHYFVVPIFLLMVLCATSGSETSAQQESFTVQVTPTIAVTSITVHVTNAYLAPGGVKSASLNALSGVQVDDFTARVNQSNHGTQDIEINVSALSSGLYLVVIQTGLLTESIKVMVLR